MFRCTLVGEYELAMRQFRFSETEVRTVAENSFRYAFSRA
jgi:adenosine deaminase